MKRIKGQIEYLTENYIQSLQHPSCDIKSHPSRTYTFMNQYFIALLVSLHSCLTVLTGPLHSPIKFSVCTIFLYFILNLLLCTCEGTDDYQFSYLSTAPYIFSLYCFLYRTLLPFIYVKRNYTKWFITLPIEKSKSKRLRMC